MEDMTYLPYYLHHNGKDSRTNLLEEEGNDVIRIALPRSKICVEFEVFAIQVVVPQQAQSGLKRAAK